jgi:ferrous iron transport protein B
LFSAPNTGKSTPFNALTGSRVTMGNWPGTTVEVSRGAWRTTLTASTCDRENHTFANAKDGLAIALLDLPGAYSLDAHSPDEQLTRDLLQHGPSTSAPPSA